MKRSRSVDRVEYILNRCAGKSVLHLGCVDYPFLDRRLAEGELLHQRLNAVAGTLYGVDIDERGLEVLRSRGFDNLFHGDIEDLRRLPIDRKFDVVLASEVLEHLANPGRFLSAVHEYVSADGRLILSVPNALNARIFLNVALGRETVHQDHTCYFSPNTLSRILEVHRFQIDELFPYWCELRSGLWSLYDRAVRTTRLISPWYGEGLVVACSYRNAEPRESH